MSNPRYGSGKQQFIGQGVEADLSVLDPGAYEGAVVYSQGELYYSDGSDWLVPQDEVDISRPRNLAPTNGLEQAQLRLSAFRSPAGESQTGIIFEFNADGLPSFTEEANVETRIVTSEVATLYDVLYPDDGFQPGDTIWWRARYLGTNSTQSQFSLPTAQTFPDLVTTPTPVTRQNAITGMFTLSPFESPAVFGLAYHETQVEFYADGATPGVDTPITTVTQQTGAVTTAPIPPLVPGESYVVRGRYGAKVNISAPTVYSDWSIARTIFLGAASIVLEYDLTLMVSRTIYVPINTLDNPLKPLNVTVDWGDGTSNTYTTAGIRSKTYAAGFTPADDKVIVTISGQMDWYGTANTIDQSGLVRVENIGFQMGLESLRGAFRGTKSYLVYITPNLPETVTSLQEAFHSSACAANLSGMDTRNIQNIAGLFFASIGAGPNCAGWDVRSVTQVAGIIRGNSQFNNAFTLGNWESLADATEMFFVDTTAAFNQPIGYWDVSNVTNMTRMFGKAFAGLGTRHPFNQDLGAWNVSNVTNMSCMFGLDHFDLLDNRIQHNFNNGGSDSIKNWDVSKVTDMSGMFRAADNFNQPIGSWNTSAVTNMSGMFNSAVTFNQPIGNWNVGNVTNMSYMFYNASVFNQPLANWERTGSTLANVTNMSRMFESCITFNQPIGNWDVSSVTNMSRMFLNTTFGGIMQFNQNIGAWDVSKVTNMSGMFGADVYSVVTNLFNNGGSPDIGGWNTSSVTNMLGMFGFFGVESTARGLVSNFNQPIGGWDVSNVTTMQDMFRSGGAAGSVNVLNQDLSGWNLRAAGVDLTGFMRGNQSLSQENYSRTLTGWANKIADVNSGPFAVSTVFANCVYNTTPYQPASRFTNAADARAYLVAARALSVSGASDANADGSYPLNSATGAYINSAGWYFLKSGSTWTLYDATNATQATGTGNFPWEVDVWTGVLSAATVLSSGAGWTITGDAAA